MDYEKIERFESKERLEELSPIETLKRAGFSEDMVLCDIGAGTGVFAFPAAKISSNSIYALEKSDDMIEILKNRIEDRNIENVIIKKVTSDILPVDDKVCDLTILITVLHHIDDKVMLFKEIRRISKDHGKIIIIEFYKRETGSGPPIEIRISEEELQKIAEDNNLEIIQKFELGSNFYGFIIQL